MTLKKKIKHLIRDFTRQPAVLNAIGVMAYAYTWLVGKTGRFEVHGIKELDQLANDNDGAIFVAWHGRALMLPFFWHGTKLIKALVSPHYDGRIIARLLRGYGILSIDGSSDRNAVGAAVEIVKELNAGTLVALIPDGPRGPRMRLNKSVIYFAQKTGKPIMGLTYSATHAKAVKKSWDAMLIPFPFSKGKIYGTKPLFVSPDANEEEMERLRLQLETELNEITFRADKECGVEEILPGEAHLNKKEGRIVKG